MKHLFLVALCVVSFGVSGCWETGTGEKVGTIIKLAKQGIFCKTWEGQMIRGGMNSGSGGFGVAPFNFTIEDERLLPKVQEAFDKQAEIKLSYRSELITFCRADSLDHFVTAVQPLTK